MLGTVPTFVLWGLVLLWSLPTLGIFVSSFRGGDAVRTTGWWTVITDPQLTTANYEAAFSSAGADAPNMWQHFLNSLAITIPATIIPLAIAAFAAYAFAWMQFPGRSWLFIGMVALLAVPIQMSLIPLLQLYVGGAHLTIFGETLTVFPDLDLAGTTHGGLAHPHRLRAAARHLPAAQLHGRAAGRHLRGGPDRRGGPHPDLLAARAPALGPGVGGVRDLPVPLGVERLPRRAHVRRWPARQRAAHRPRRVAGRLRGQDWHLLTAAAFISIALPLVVFFSLQRFFVRGLLAGSVKG